MTPHELTELKGRCITAQQYGRKIANADVYTTTLEALAGPMKLGPGIARHSAKHLLALIAQAERVQSGQAPVPQKVVPKPAPEPAVVPSQEDTQVPEVVAKEEPKTEVVAKEEPKPEPKKAKAKSKSGKSKKKAATPAEPTVAVDDEDIITEVGDDDADDD